jgi:hypothetical protein
MGDRSRLGIRLREVRENTKARKGFCVWLEPTRYMENDGPRVKWYPSFSLRWNWLSKVRTSLMQRSSLYFLRVVDEW